MTDTNADNWTPAILPAGLLAAWNVSDPANVANSAFVSQIPGAWGSTALLSRGPSGPSLGAGLGPGQQNCMTFERAQAQHCLFDPLPVGDLHAFVVLDFSKTSGDQVIFGHQTASSPTLRLVSNSGGFATLSVKTLGGGFINVPLPYRKSAGRFELLEVAYSAAAGTITLTQDGLAGTPVFVGATGFPFNQLSGCKGANHLDGMVGPVLFFSRLLTNAEVASLRAFLAPWCSKTFYISATGDDLARGDRPDRAWASLAKIEQLGARCRPGDTFVVLGGMEIRRSSKFSPPVSGAPQQPCTLRGESSAMKARIFGSKRYLGGWTPNPNGSWSRSDLTEQPLMLWLTRGPGQAEPIIRRPLTQPYSFTYTNGTLAVVLGPGELINNSQIEIAGKSTFSFYEGSRTNWTFENLIVQHMPRDAFSPQGATGLHVRNVELLYNANDAWGPGGGTDLVLEDFIIRGSGQGKTDNSAAGDGISHHGNASATVRRGLIEDCMKAGIDDERGATVTYEDVIVRNCNHNYRWLNQSASSALGGAQSLTRVRIERGPADFADGVQIEAGLDEANYQFAASDCTVASTDSGPRRGIAFNTASASIALNNCRAEGFAVGQAGGVMTLMSSLIVT